MERLINFIAGTLFVIVSAALVAYIMFFAPLDTAQGSVPAVSVENTSWECMHYQHKDMTLYHVTVFNNSDRREPVNYSWEGTKPGSGRVSLGKNSGSYLNIWIRPGHFIENIRVEVDGQTIFYRVKPFTYKEKCR